MDSVTITKTFLNVSFGQMDSGQQWSSVTVMDSDPQVKRDPGGNNFVGSHVAKINIVGPDGKPDLLLATKIGNAAQGLFLKPITLICTMETTKSGIAFKCVGVELPANLKTA
ncbi:hypothetical protein [Alishewanella jeotgali]|uniref:Uncharacterized protein n=1 Tax=Alishewanella jeotgali KCTC 22429 TaxID=1129374 RepID=H3Z9Z8_9ALTE|nr:hypothetical protein [Alishewanella jeotgali]EHR42673.1 hypothetical protein AJE_00750 [Alishewanella jeotgali KCTC 22429]